MIKNRFIVLIFSAFVKITGYLPAIIFLSPRVVFKGKRIVRLPKGSILVSNHQSLMDFVLYLMVFPFNTLRFLMAEVLFKKGKLFATFLKLLGGIETNRDAKDFGFVSDSVEVLDNGGVLGVFPESRLPVKGKPFPFTVSTAYIARLTGAPIIPVYTDGRYAINKRAGVVIGKPLYFSDFLQPDLSDDMQLKHFTDVLQNKVYSLKDLLDKE